MKRPEAWLLIFLFVGSPPFLGTPADTLEVERSFRAELSGKEEVPPVETNAKGDTAFKIDKEGALIYLITLRNVENVTAAQIHQGQKGCNGPPVVILFAEPKLPAISGTLYGEGRIRGYELIGPLKGRSLQSLVQLFSTGSAYVNVQTAAHPEGEIRGQIKRQGCLVRYGEIVTTTRGRLFLPL